MKKISVVLPVLAPTPFLRAMTEFAIKTLRAHADNPFELVVVEAVHDWFDPARFKSGNDEWTIEKYLNFTPPIGAVQEGNAALDAATGDFIVYTGTDVIVPQGWDTELLSLFERPDCGVAALSAFEPGWIIGPREPLDLVVEGMFSPFMMFRKGERFDEAYQRVYIDSDLVMRIYERGLRAFRSCRKHVWHFGSVTNKHAGEAHARKETSALALDEGLFYQRWGKSPLAMFGMIRAGQWLYGHEHESLTGRRGG